MKREKEFTHEDHSEIEAPELQGYFNPNKKFNKIYPELFIKHYRGIIQDIETRRDEFILLALIFASIGSIIAITINFSIFFLNFSLFGNLNEYNLAILFGLICGIIFSGLMIDFFDKKLTLIQYLLVIETFNLVFQVIIFINTTEYSVFNFISFFITAFITTSLFLLYITLFLGFSSILERGRVFSYLIITTLLIVVVISVISAIGVKGITFFLFIPLIFNVLTVLYIYKKKNLEVPLIREHQWEEKHINTIAVKYSFFIFFFCFTMGLATPVIEIEWFISQAVQLTVDEKEILYVFALLIILSSITALIIGMVFDFMGRLKTISSIIVLISIASILYFFYLPILYIEYIVIISLYVAVLMTVPLLVGDITKRKNFGKIITIDFAISMVGIFFGIALKSYIPLWLSEEGNSSLVLLGILYISSVISLALLVNSKETLPHKEKEWYESLIHLYIVHKHGILLFEHPFTKQQEKIEGDLVSGGIIGLISLLKEIIKGKETLRIVDHGDMKLLLKYSPKKDVIFVLMIREDLLTLRNKLDDFSIEFIEKYHQKLDKLEYVNVKDWESVSKLIDKYFERKYFEILDIL